MAHAGYSTPFWESNVVTGVSIDNLAPGAPLALNALLAGGDGHLGWAASGHHDEDLSEYRVHRSPTPGFVPDGTTFLAATADTNLVDVGLPGGAWYYRVIAVDVHGNGSEPSNEARLESLAAAGDLPNVFVVSGAVPNPFNPSTEIHFVLPEAADVRVEIYDLRGARVAVPRTGRMPAGRQAVAWDGRDGDGRLVPSGVYFARVAAGGEARTVKLLLSK